MTGLGFAAGLAEGVAKAGDNLANAIEKSAQIGAQIRLHQEDLQMKALEINTPERIAQGLPYLDLSDPRNPMVMTPPQEMITAAQQHIMKIQETQIAMQKPIKDQQISAISGALQAISGQEEVPGLLPHETETVNSLSKSSADQIAQGLVVPGSGGAAISNTLSSQLSGESKYQRQSALQAQKTEGQMAIEQKKSDSAMERLKKTYEFKGQFQEKEFAHDFEMLGFKYDKENDKLILQATLKKDVMKQAQTRGLSTYEAAKILLEIEQDPYTLRLINRQLADSGQPPITAKERAFQLIDEAKSMKEATPEGSQATPPQNKPPLGDLLPKKKQ